MRWQHIGLGAFVVVAGAVAWSQAPKSGLVERFKQVDKNSDGKVTPEELKLPALFKRLDQNSDGVITLEEAQQAVARGVLKSDGQPAPEATQPATQPAANSVGSKAAAPVRQGPLPIKPGEHGVGKMVPDVSFSGIDGETRRLSDWKTRYTVVAFTSTSCPLSQKYLPSLLELAQSETDVAFVLVNPMPTDKVEEMQVAAKAFGDRAVYVHDKSGDLARAVGATSTTDVCLLDGSRTVLYHGALDDQYGFGYSLESPRRRYLVEALAAAKSNRSPLVTATVAPGCELDLKPVELKPTDITYHNRISRLMQKHCVECHREGGVGPFVLDTYADVVGHAAMIKQVVERGVMPPWFAAKPTEEAQSAAVHWLNDRSLADGEKRDLLAWLGSGKVEGDVKEAPQPRVFEEGWLIGKPDAVYQFAKPMQVKATGTMPYQNVVVETRLSEDRWVQAIEIQPGDRTVVHHVLIFVKGSQDDSANGDDEEGRGGFWAAYVPGNSRVSYPAGFAKRLPKNAQLRFQMHYTPNGKATEDTTRVGVIFAKEAPRHEVRVAGIVNPRLSIPPGADNHREEAVLRLPYDVQVMGFMPHMHLRGKACRYELVSSASGSSGTTTLLDVPRYDFNWQLMYRTFDPLPMSRGDTIKFTAWFDNSSKNPANPDPTRTVRWGPQTFDEMHLGYIEYFMSDVIVGEKALPGGRAALPAQALEAFFERLDDDHDKRVTREEILKARDSFPRLKDNPKLLDAIFPRLDLNQDGGLDLDEFRKARDVVRGGN